MNTIMFRTAAPTIAATMLVFSVYITLRGHNEPGGGFIGGLIAASAIAVLGMAGGRHAARRALFFDPVSIAAFGVLLSGASGLLSIFIDKPFLTSIWFYLDVAGAVIPLSTPLFFDLGVYLVVLGAISAIALGLESDDGEDL